MGHIIIGLVLQYLLRIYHLPGSVSVLSGKGRNSSHNPTNKCDSDMKERNWMLSGIETEFNVIKEIWEKFPKKMIPLQRLKG